MMLELIRKCFDKIGLRQGNPIRSFLSKVFWGFVNLWYRLLHNCQKLYQKIHQKIHINCVQHRYKYILKGLHTKASKNEKTVVGFYVIFDSVFSFRPLFEKMLKDDFFDPYIVIIPDTSRGKKNEIEQAKQTSESLMQKYGPERVILGYDYQNDTYSDPSDRFDIIAFANPYDNMTHQYYSLKYLCHKNVLTIFANYFYPAVRYSCKVFALPFHSLVWKVFIENQEIFNELKKYSLLRGKNYCVTGFCKMDLYADAKRLDKTRKTIILAPHHTVGKEWEKTFALSNFLSYYDLIQKLPTLYPDIDFVFRPHPLLLVSLVNFKIWTQEQVDQYIEKLTSHPNMTFSKSGEYFDLFANSDGIIHDCSSFTLEYLYTGAPACYVLKNKAEIQKEFLDFGQKALENYYQVFSEEDIIKFIDEVVIKGEDPLKEKRCAFAKEHICYNYPHVSDEIMNYIKKSVRGK